MDLWKYEANNLYLHYKYRCRYLIDNFAKQRLNISRCLMPKVSHRLCHYPATKQTSFQMFSWIYLPSTIFVSDIFRNSEHLAGLCYGYQQCRLFSKSRLIHLVENISVLQGHIDWYKLIDNFSNILRIFKYTLVAFIQYSKE